MATISDLVDEHRPDLAAYEELYRHLHANPELSNQEKGTAATIASHLRSLSPDLDIRTNIGGHGLVAVLRNGEGPTILLRADFDALPIAERTGLPYASTKTMPDADGVVRPVMHACGHDMHTSALLAASSLLLSARPSWSGTLVLLFQPAEERGTGARAMVDDGLYTTHAVPVPDLCLGGHVMPQRAGWLGTRRGTIMSSANSLRVVMHGRGGHASMPERLVDPVVMAASAIVKLQTIVSREISPWEPAVVTVASVQAGDAENVVVDDARLAIDIRSTTEPVRARALSSVRRILRAESDAARAPAPPTITETRNFPLTVNDDAVTARVEESFAAHFAAREGTRYVADSPAMSGSEDFPLLSEAVGKPYCFFLYGGTDTGLWDRCEAEDTLQDRIPVNHSAMFAPVIQPTLTVGMEAYAVGALTWLVKGN